MQCVSVFVFVLVRVWVWVGVGPCHFDAYNRETALDLSKGIIQSTPIICWHIGWTQRLTLRSNDDDEVTNDDAAAESESNVYPE